jgi:putative flippase GtrA/glycosyltransferase involved in cell wall biosynthesis
MQSPSKVIKRELMRSVQFLSVSFISAATNLLYIVALTHLSTLPFWFVSLSSTEFSMVVNFVLNDRITFRNLKSNHVWFVRLARFQIAALGGNLLTAAISTTLHDGLSLSPVYAQGIAIVLTFFVNFLVHRFWTFKKRPAPGNTIGTLSSLAVTGAGNESQSMVPALIDGVSIIVPVRNESATIGPLLMRLHQAMISGDLVYEVLVVDDCSLDETAKIAATTIDEHRLPGKVLMKFGKVGKSFSLMQGFAKAQYSILAMIDGDLELPPEALPDMVRQLSCYDIVVGRRLGYSKSNFLRGQFSRIFNRLVLRLFLGIHCEAQTGIKVFWKHVYESMDLFPGPWGFDLELVAQAMSCGFRIGEHDVLFQKRRLGPSKVNPVMVAVELLSIAVRTKLYMVQDGKASATLKTATITRDHPGGRVLNVNSMVPAVLDWLVPLALLYLFLRQMMGQSFFSSQRFFGTPGDANQCMWFIGWVWHAIAMGHSPLESDAFNYPYPINIMDYTSVPLLGFLFGWLYNLTGIVLIYNVIVVVNYALILLFGKLMLRTLGVGRVFSSVGGLLFCLIPYLTAQELAHLNLAFISPLFIVSYVIARVIRSTRPPGWIFGILIGLALTLAFYTDLETFVTMALCLGVLFGFALLCSFRSTYQFSLKVLNVRFLLGLGTTLLLVIPGALNFVQGQGPEPLNVAFLSLTYSNDLLSPVVPTSVYLVHTSATTALTSRFSGNLNEWDGYLSVPFILCFIVCAVRGWHKPVTRTLTYSTLCMFILALGPALHVGGVDTRIFLPGVLTVPVPFIQDALPARLSLYVGCLAIVVVVRGVDDAMKRDPVQLRRLKLRLWHTITFAALGLTVVLWLPLLPTYTAAMPMAATILRSDQVVPRYISHEPTLVLYGERDGFNVVMGILAASNDYNLVTSNVYGYTMLATPSYKLNQRFIADTDGKQTALALQQYLPELRVGKVMFVSTDDKPISSDKVLEISKLLGVPDYNRGGLVVIWTVPQRFGT